MPKKDSDLFYTCSLIEYIGRKQKLRRGDVVQHLAKMFRQIYFDAPVLHCEPIAKIADEIISMCHIPNGNYDNVADCKYLVPDYWTIGDVFERLITDSHSEGDIMDTAELIYNAWITDAQLDFNSDFYYQPSDYIYACYREGGYLDG